MGQAQDLRANSNAVGCAPSSTAGSTRHKVAELAQHASKTPLGSQAGYALRESAVACGDRRLTPLLDHRDRWRGLSCGVLHGLTSLGSWSKRRDHGAGCSLAESGDG